MRLFFELLLGLMAAINVIACAKLPSATSNDGALMDRLDAGYEIFLQSGSPAPIRQLSSKPISSIRSREHYIIEAEWKNEDSFVCLHSHTNGFDFRDGVEIQLQRHGKDLKVSLSTPGRSSLVMNPFLDFFRSGYRRRIMVEVHNGVRDGVRVLVWREDINPDAATPQARDLFTAQSASMDTRNNNFIFSQPARGIYFGSESSGVTHLIIQRVRPFVSDDLR